MFGRNLGVRNVIVEMTGRRTGRVREIPLFAFEDGDRVVVIGSNAGDDREPAWVGNLRANPAASVRIGRKVRQVRARETEGEERDRLWALGGDRLPGVRDVSRPDEPPDPGDRPRASLGRGGCLTVPAPLGKTPTRKMPDIQVFGRDDSAATRAALRFFRERRVVVHYVDLRKNGIAPGELRRFTDRLGAAALLDTDSRPYREGGIAYLSTDAAGIVARLLADVRLLMLPLVRYGDDVTAGKDEAAWRAWLARPK